MATITRPERRLRPEIETLLDRLRSRIRTYVLLEGIAVVLAILAALFWFTLFLDHAYFRLTNLELPVVFRGLLVAAAVLAVAAAVMTFLAFRLVRKLHAKALALVLERRFPELNDRLILAVENAERLTSEPRNALHDSMLERAADEVSVAVERLDVADVFDRKPLRRASLAAVLLLVPILLLVALQPQALATWWSAYGKLSDVYHIRDTFLQMTVLVPPDERARVLTPGGVHKHPRGTNLTLLIDVPSQSSTSSKKWIVPQAVSVRRYADGGGRQTLPAMKVGDRRFRITIEEIREGMDLWVTGGDYTNAAAFRIDAVDPPKLAQVDFEALYPAYTGLNRTDGQGKAIAEKVSLTSPVLKVPAGTFVTFQGRANKPIRNATIRFGENELSFGEFDADDGTESERRSAFTVRGSEPEVTGTRLTIPDSIARDFISEDGRTVSVPLLVAGETASFLPAGPTNRSDLSGRALFTIPLNTPVRVTLEDTDLVSSIDSSRFEIRGVSDTPPKPAIKLRGVSEKITRTATIPVEGVITDDYGIVDANFDFKTSEMEEWESRPLRNGPQGSPKEFVLKRDANSSVEWLDTATLNLKQGQQLTVAVAAVDNDLLTGPNVAKSDEFRFTIVSPEELLTELYNREINQRKAFERSLEEMKQVRLDLAEQNKRKDETESRTENGQRGLQSAADRAYAETRQNANEVDAISGSFRQILEELINNRVHTEKQLDRIRAGVLLPLQRLVDQRFPKLDRAIGDLRLRLSEGKELTPGFNASIQSADELITEMEAALREMQDLAEFHEAIQELNQILTDEQDLLDRTKVEQKRSVIDSLDGLLD